MKKKVGDEGVGVEEEEEPINQPNKIEDTQSWRLLLFGENLTEEMARSAFFFLKCFALSFNFTTRLF